MTTILLIIIWCACFALGMLLTGLGLFFVATFLGAPVEMARGLEHDKREAKRRKRERYIVEHGFERVSGRMLRAFSWRGDDGTEDRRYGYSAELTAFQHECARCGAGPDEERDPREVLEESLMEIQVFVCDACLKAPSGSLTLLDSTGLEGGLTEAIEAPTGALTQSGEC